MGDLVELELAVAAAPPLRRFFRGDDLLGRGADAVGTEVDACPGVERADWEPESCGDRRELMSILSKGSTEVQATVDGNRQTAGSTNDPGPGDTKGPDGL